MAIDIATPIAVSVLVGVPFILVVVCIVACHLRRKRLMIQEDEQDKDLEAGLKEDLLYAQFTDELQNRIEKIEVDDDLTEKSLTLTIAVPTTLSPNTITTETPSNTSPGINSVGSTPAGATPADASGCASPVDSTLAGTIPTPTETNASKLPITPKKYMKRAFIPPSDLLVLAANNSRLSSSAYDFYDTMIPVMALEESNSLKQPINVLGNTTFSSNNSLRSFGRRSIDTTALIKTLEALAVLLHSPQFTKKLHLETYTQATPPRSRDSSYPSLPELTRPLALRADVPSSLTSLSESIVVPSPEVLLIPEELIEPPKALIREGQNVVTVVV